MFVVLTFAAGPERGECLAVSRGDKLSIGDTVLAANVTAQSHVDPGAMLAAGDGYYDLRGLSDCSLTAGP